jgi:hypothetical protein
VNVFLPAACFVLSRRFSDEPQGRRWATYSWITGALILLISIPSTIGLPFAYRAGFPVVDGRVQRILLLIGWGWLTLVALHLWRKARKARSEAAFTGIAETVDTAD